VKKLGLSVCSLFSLQDAPEVDVLSYSTDSRGVASQEAYRHVCDAFTRLGKGTDFCNKRIDSTLRGNIGAEIDAIATTPINKEALRAAHVNYIGHTEILGALSHSRDPLTMFEVDGLRVFFLKRHMSLREACDAVKKDRVRSSLSSSRQSSSASAISRSSRASPRGSAARSAASASSSASAS
jgi:hypothetical protein